MFSGKISSNLYDINANNLRYSDGMTGDLGSIGYMDYLYVNNITAQNLDVGASGIDQLSIVDVNTSNDTKSFIIGPNSGNTLVSSQGIHMGYNSLTKQGIIYSLSEVPITTDLLLCESDSYGSGILRAPSMSTNSISEKTATQGIVLNSYINVKSTGIEAQAGSLSLTTSSGFDISLNGMLINDSGDFLKSAGIFKLASDTPGFLFNNQLEIKNVGQTISTKTSDLNITANNNLVLNTNLNLDSTGRILTGSGQLTINSTTNPIILNSKVNITASGQLTTTNGVENQIFADNEFNDANRWISVSAGSSPNSQNRVIMGNFGGDAIIGGHVWNGSSYTGWQELYINKSGGNVHVGSPTSKTGKLNIEGIVDLGTTTNEYRIGGNTALSNTALRLYNGANSTTFTTAATGTRAMTIPDSDSTLVTTGNNLFHITPNTTYSAGSSYPTFTQYFYFTYRPPAVGSYDNGTILASFPATSTVSFNIYNHTAGHSIKESSLTAGSSTPTQYYFSGGFTNALPSTESLLSIGFSYSAGSDSIFIYNVQFFSNV